MSWILGFTGTSLSRPRRERLAALCADEAPLHRVDDRGLFLAAGGLPETCLAGTLPDGGDWLVVGLGLVRRDDACRLLSRSNWRRRLSAASPRLRRLGGHFVALRRRAGRVEVFTDPLGVRTLYWTRLGDGTAFSTRADWLARLCGGASLDVSAFSAHWRAFNLLSPRSLVEGLERLGAGGRAVFSPDAAKAELAPWTPSFAPASPEAFADVLTAYLRPQAGERSASLGLSGGLDSRLLLALVPPEDDLRVHVFGPRGHPDVGRALHLAETAGRPATHLHLPLPEADTLLALLRRQAVETLAVSPASSVAGLRYYPLLHGQGKIVVDGGFGEVARRQFFNRLLQRGRRALAERDAGAIAAFIQTPRADVFREDVGRAMEAGVREQLAEVLAALPDPGDVGWENVLDLLGVRARLPHFFGFEQNRLDARVMAYMPFAQPEVLEVVFGLPLSARQNGQLFRRLIRQRQPALARQPLVKGRIPYPFALGPLAAFAWTKVSAHLRPPAPDPVRPAFLERLRPYALDRVHDADVANHALYDPLRLRRLVEAYYGGDENLAPQVDWWLSLDALLSGIS